MCQKVINVLSIASFAVSVAVVGSVGYVYLNKDAIIQGVTEKALGGLGGGLPTGANDLPSLGATPSLSGPSPTVPSTDAASL